MEVPNQISKILHTIENSDVPIVIVGTRRIKPEFKELKETREDSLFSTAAGAFANYLTIDKYTAYASTLIPVSETSIVNDLIKQVQETIAPISRPFSGVASAIGTKSGLDVDYLPRGPKKRYFIGNFLNLGNLQYAIHAEEGLALNLKIQFFPAPQFAEDVMNNATKTKVIDSIPLQELAQYGLKFNGKKISQWNVRMTGLPTVDSFVQQAMINLYTR